MNVTTSCDRKHSPSTTGRLREASNRPPHRVAGVRRCHRGLAGVANQSEGLEVGWTADWASWGILSRFVLQIAGRTGVPTHAQWWTPLRCGSPRSARRPSAPGRPPLPGPAACSEKAAIGNPTCYPCCRFVLSPMFPAAQQGPFNPACAAATWEGNLIIGGSQPWVGPAAASETAPAGQQALFVHSDRSRPESTGNANGN
jgi:hypothetical protein